MADAITHADDTGLTLTVKIRTSATTVVNANLTEGTGDGVGFYAVTEAQLVSVGLTVAGDYTFKVLSGGIQVGSGSLIWTGSAVGSISGVTFPTNFSTLTVANIQSGLATEANVNARTLVASAYATATALDAVDNYVDSEVGAIKTVTDRLDTAMVLDGLVYKFTTNALSLAPTGGLTPTEVADAVWDALQDDHVDAGTFGLYLDAAVSGVSTGGVSAAAIADAVWDEVTTGHTTLDSFALAMLDIPITAELNARTLPAASYATATAVNAVDDYIDSEVAAIKTVTDKLDTALVVDGAVWRYTVNALSLAPLGGEVIVDSEFSPVSADIVSSARTWRAIEYRATNIVEVGDNFAGALSLEPDLNPRTSIVTVSSVSITGAATVTATDLTVTRDKKRANFTVPALSTVGTYTVVVTVTTTDGQTIPTTATLKVY